MWIATFVRTLSLVRDERRPHVIVMAKSPIPGRVKTRLCPPLSADTAASIAEAALCDTLEKVSRCAGVRPVLALDGPVSDWLPEGYTVVPQVAGTLSDRLRAAWTTAGAPGIQIGMDTPQISTSLIESLIERLFTPDFDAIFGPAFDGGWWTIGFRDFRPDVFDGIPTSTPDTGRMQLERLHEMGLRVDVAETLRDLDTIDDAIEISSTIPGSRTAIAVQRALSVLAA